jgi:hypothetical protein
MCRGVRAGSLRRRLCRNHGYQKKEDRSNVGKFHTVTIQVAPGEMFLPVG